MTNPLKVAVIGTGHLGKFHARILSSLPGVKLVGVVDADRATAEAVAAEYNTSAFSDAVAVADLIDAAVIAVPTRFHAAVGVRLLSAGVHCLIEKPLASTLREAHELNDAAHRGRAVLAVGHVEKFNPGWAAACANIEDPRYIEAHRLSSHSFRSTDIGAVFDLMIHDLGLVLALVKQPLSRVEAMGLSVLGGHEDVANARLTFDGGCVAVLNASRVSYAAKRSMHLWGPSGFVGVDFATRSAEVVTPSAALRSRSLRIENLSAEEKNSVKQNLFTDYLPRKTIEAPACDQLTEELQDFLTAVRTGGKPRTSGDEAVETVAVAERILDEIALHAWNGRNAGPKGPHVTDLRRPSETLQGPHWNRSELQGDSSQAARRSEER
jgi:predicted dehydrogenase